MSNTLHNNNNLQTKRQINPLPPTARNPQSSHSLRRKANARNVYQFVSLSKFTLPPTNEFLSGCYAISSLPCMHTLWVCTSSGYCHLTRLLHKTVPSLSSNNIPNCLFPPQQRNPLFVNDFSSQWTNISPISQVVCFLFENQNQETVIYY